MQIEQKMQKGIGVGHYPEKANITKQIEILSTFNGDTIRFMDWQQINNFRPKSTNDLPLAYNNWQYTKGAWNIWSGVPIAMCIKVANKLGRRAWINIHNSLSPNDIEIVIKSAIQICEQRPIFEFSNEIWNDRFTQKAECAKKWEQIVTNTKSDPLKKALSYQAHITEHMIHVTGKNADVVLSGQSKNSWILKTLLDAMKLKPKAIAIAPYFGMSITKHSANAFQQMHDEINTKIRKDINDHNIVAKSHNTELWCYEGGNHTTGKHAANLNRDNMMTDLMRFYLSMMEETGVRRYMHYNAASVYNNTNAWGAYEIAGDDLIAQPKAIPLLN